MPHVERFGTYVILSLSGTEKFFGFHKNIQVKYKDLLSVKPVANAWTRKVLRGVRAPGTGLPYVVALGTWRLRKGKNFVAVYRKRPAYIFTFTGGDFQQWIITPDNTRDELAKMFEGTFEKN